MINLNKTVLKAVKSVRHSYFETKGVEYVHMTINVMCNVCLNLCFCSFRYNLFAEIYFSNYNSLYFPWFLTFKRIFQSQL